MQELSNLPKAPRRFQIIDIENDVWTGNPSVPYGVIRRIAHERRKSESTTYLRVIYGEAGRRGDPWGGLALEVCGRHYHFTAGVKRWPNFHDGSGNLTIEGQQALGSGVQGYLSTACDWRWVQDEVDLTHRLTAPTIERIAAFFADIQDGRLPVPMFQARKWAKRWGQEIHAEHYNCTTIVLNQLNTLAATSFQENMPLPAMDALCNWAGGVRTRLDDEVNYFLNKSEKDVQDKLATLSENQGEVDWDGIAKGVTSLPLWFTWQLLTAHC